MAIVGGLFATLFLRLLGARRRFLAAGLSAVVIAFYALMVGAEPSVVRAAIMGVLSLFAVQLGRRQDGLNSLALVAALMLVFSPFLLWDVSFQLSFMATLGLVLFAGVMTAAFARLASRRLPEATAQRLAKPVGEYVLFTLAALLTTLPVMAYHFHRLSLTALIANPLILPAQPPVMVLGGLAAALGLIYQPLGQAGGLPGLALRGLHHPGSGAGEPHPRRGGNAGRGNSWLGVCLLRGPVPGDVCGGAPEERRFGPEASHWCWQAWARWRW